MSRKKKVEPLVGKRAVCKAWVSMLVLDFGVLRPFFNRPKQVMTDIWRSNQPTPFRLNSLSAKGFSTVLSLRGASNEGYHLLEMRACEKLGLDLVAIKMSSRRPPSVKQVELLYDVYKHSGRPLLLHCKSGADRAGLVSAIFLLFDGVSIERAKKQLSLRHLHFRHAKTGGLDHFLESYETFNAHTPVSFIEWVRNHYDRDTVEQGFTSSGVVSWLVDGVLRRE